MLINLPLFMLKTILCPGSLSHISNQMKAITGFSFISFDKNPCETETEYWFSLQPGLSSKLNII